ncbi:heme exporter protein CcmD [Sinimarinibacterium thermocellulolyticum]|uniref:Heme exporter protein D n=1 Tax=Sinimarinibacterium thermocellulolyticum TaxID=3170016 RepID=A0ABV2A8F2_9GAMM
MDTHFWQMSGYAVYVWGSFGVAALVFAWAWLAPLRRRRALLDAIREAAEDA